MSTSGKVALYKTLAQNANGAEAAKPRYLRSGVYFFFANFTVLDTLCLLHTFEENERCVKIDERKNESR